MELKQGNKYIYTNTVRVGRTCKRTTKQQTVVYIGTEGNKQVFETESGTEILLHNDDVKNLIKEVTEEQFNAALDVLPPLKWCTIDGIEMFCISEMTDGTYTTQYAHNEHNGKYYCATVDVMDKSTWINNRI